MLKTKNDYCIGGGFSADGRVCSEPVSSIQMSEHMEIFPDPSYHEQSLTFASPHVGSYGIDVSDFQRMEV